MSHEPTNARLDIAVAGLLGHRGLGLHEATLMDAREQMVAAGSKKVRGYVKDMLAHRKLEARIAAREAAIEPLRRRRLILSTRLKTRELKLTGTQRAAAERLLASPAIEALAKPCKVEVTRV